MTKKEKNLNKHLHTGAGFVKFLGTAGARFVMIRQLRSSGGIWISANDKNIIFDPGPGSIVQCNKSRPKLNPEKLDAIILSHKHLDHCSDVNVMIEAMTEGGKTKKGLLFCPSDALNDDPVILQYSRKLPQDVIALKEKQTYKIDGFEFQTSMRHIHSAETYGIKFKIGKTSISFLTDTKYFPELSKFYNTDILVISVVFFEPRPQFDHLSMEDVRNIIKESKPKKAILTHFGMTMLANKPNFLAEQLTKKLKTEVIAAYDGMAVQF